MLYYSLLYLIIWCFVSSIFFFILMFEGKKEDLRELTFFVVVFFPVILCFDLTDCKTQK